MSGSLKALGEFGIIKKIRSSIKTNKSVFKGIGDDAAVLEYTKDKYLLFTCDMLIEDFHFKLNRLAFEKIGWKALGCSISDIAAMGGIPKWAVISIGVSGLLRIKDIENIYKGIKNIAKRFSVNIVGGDTVKSKKLVIDVSLLGEVKKKNLVLRSGAKVGDFIFVTGRLGGSIYGKHLSFIPRMNESQILVKHFKINSMIDISDGLAGDLKRLLEESKVGAAISEIMIPLSKKAKSVKNALTDGEDYELLFTADEKSSEGIVKRFSKYSKLKITPIGKIMPKKFGFKIIDKFNHLRNVGEKGFTNF